MNLICCILHFITPQKKYILDTPTIVRLLVYPPSSQVGPVYDAFQNAAPPSGIDDRSGLWLSCLGPFGVRAPKTLKLYAFAIF